MEEFTDTISHHEENEIPTIESGMIYYDGTKRYISPPGLAFNPNEGLSIKDMEDSLSTKIHKVGRCTLNDRENNPLRYTKKGYPYKKQKEIIDGADYKGVLIKFESSLDELWYGKDTEGIYFITFDDHIVKIGMTENNFSNRFGSYNCGTRRAMEKGSCSTTNYIICEVLYAALILKHKVDIYGITIPKEKRLISAYGQKVNCPVSVIRAHEEIITNIYKSKVGKIPPLCVQHATNI